VLHSLSLENFRSWEGRTTLRTARLTLLTGPNNSGKSSFLGILKALIQSEQVRSKEELRLSGRWADLGAFDQNLPPAHRQGGFSVGLTGEVPGMGPIDVVWDFGATADPGEESARVQRIEAQVGSVLHVFEPGPGGVELAVDGDPPVAAILPGPASFIATGGPFQGQLVQLLPYRSEEIQSVSPFRALPERGVYLQRRGSEGPATGQYGEHAAELAVRQGSREVEILPPDGVEPAPERFDRAVSRWYSYILDERFDLRVEELRRYGYKVVIGSSWVEDLTFSQVGFGLSQIWPIVVAGLAARRGHLALVESPEAHLHPAAQHRLARLFVEMAREGRQVFVETHSEHILASVCLGVKQGRLAPEDVAVHFFQLRDGVSEVSEISVDRDGRRLQTPPGFFDQASKEILELLQ